MRKIKTTKALLTGGKILVFDLETSDLAANRGFIICAAAKWVGKRDIFTFRIDDTPGYRKTPRSMYNDSAIVKELVKLCDEAEAVIAHYGAKFDVPFLNTRAIAQNLRPTKPLTVIDTWVTARKQLRLARNDLGSVVSLVGGAGSKFHLPWEDWQVAKFGCSKSISKLIHYCKNDVRILEKAYLKLRPVIRNHPYIGPVLAASPQTATRCPACGSTKTHGHDVRRTQHFEVYRQRCVNCGTAYESGRKKLK